jgi:hypothetical protein
MITFDDVPSILPIDAKITDPVMAKDFVDIDAYTRNLPMITPDDWTVKDPIVYYPGMSNDVANAFLMTNAKAVVSVDIPDEAYANGSNISLGYLKYKTDVCITEGNKLTYNLMLTAVSNLYNFLNVREVSVTVFNNERFEFRFRWKGVKRYVIYQVGNYNNILPDVPRIDIVLDKGGGMPRPVYYKDDYLVTPEMAGKAVPTFDGVIRLLSRSEYPLLVTMDMPEDWPVEPIMTVNVVMDDTRHPFRTHLLNIDHIPDVDLYVSRVQT